MSIESFETTRMRGSHFNDATNSAVLKIKIFEKGVFCHGKDFSVLFEALT